MNKKITIKDDCFKCPNYSWDNYTGSVGYCEPNELPNGWDDYTRKPVGGTINITIKEGIPNWCPLPDDIQDDPLLDNTDFAHPAFWRGQLSGVHGACKSIESILDGKDDGSGVANDERLEKLRRRLLGATEKLKSIINLYKF